MCEFADLCQIEDSLSLKGIVCGFLQNNAANLFVTVDC
jgi:hypothetical protein